MTGVAFEERQAATPGAVSVEVRGAGHGLEEDSFGRREMEVGDTIETGVAGDQGADRATDGGVGPRVSVENGDLDGWQRRGAGGGGGEGENESFQHFDFCGWLKSFGPRFCMIEG